MYQRIKDKLFGWWADVVSRHPWLVLVVTLAMAAAAVLVTVSRAPMPLARSGHIGPLQFQSNRNDLISPRLEWNRRFIRWQDGFPGTTDLVIVADTGPDDAGHAERARKVEAMFRELGPALQREEWVRQVVWGFDKMSVSAKAVRLATFEPSKPTDEFRSRMDEIAGAGALLAADGPEGLIAGIIAQVRESEAREKKAASENNAAQAEADIMAGLMDLAHTLNAFSTSLERPLATATQPADAASPATDLNREIAVQKNPGGLWQYLVSENGRLYFMRVTPRKDVSQINALAPAIAAVRRVLADIGGKYPDVRAGLTGIDVVEADETDAATWDGTWTSIVSAALIAGTLILAFHSWRTPVMLMFSLAVAIAWTFGFTTMAIGHVQVISVVFVPLLLGLGIAYGIYVAARFEMIRHRFPDTPDGFAAAMNDTFRTMGPGILTGCITTAAAFLMTLFTDFTGVAEMGLIASVGVVLCLIAMVTVFPALMRLFKPGHRHVTPLSDRLVSFYRDHWFMPFVRHPRTTIVVAISLTLISLVSLIGMKFDYNLLKLQPTGLDSVQWEHRIVQDGGESIWFGVSIVESPGPSSQPKHVAAAQSQPGIDANKTELPPEVARLVERYRSPSLRHVGVVRGMGLLIPADDQAKIKYINDHKIKFAIDQAISRRGQAIFGGLEFQVGVLAGVFAKQANAPDVPPHMRPSLRAVGEALNRLLKAMNDQKVEPQARQLRLARLTNEFHLWRDEVEGMVFKALDARPLGINDLPPEILSPYRGADGSLSVEIFPRLPDPDNPVVSDVLDPRFLPKFVGEMRSVDPNVTGVSVQIYESGLLIQNSYVLAGVLGLFVVFMLVLIDFHSLRDAMVSLLPVLVGFAVCFGIMRLSGVSINPANIIVLPLMFGIGVDSGVHMIYRCRMDRHGCPPGLTQGTGKGVIIVNLTTLIGFGALMAARHRGIQSLGFVLSMGMAMTLLACLTLMPAWLELRRRRGIRESCPVSPEVVEEQPTTLRK